MLDAWIGNTDRHHENWGLIVAKDRSISLAPTFDHASSLGRELNDETRIRRLSTQDNRYSVGAFAEKARSALYVHPSDRRAMSPIRAFMYAARVQRESALHWVEVLEGVSKKDVRDILDRVPSHLMSQPAKEFAYCLLEVNKTRLLSEVRSKQ